MLEDTDALETQEWVEALESVVRHSGVERASYIMAQLADRAARTGVELPSAITTPYCNTIPARDEKKLPGDLQLERKIRCLVRWNAMAMVMRANDNNEG